MDEVSIKISGVLHYLWRAVDQDGDELDILVQKRRNKKTAMKFFKKLLKGQQATPLKLGTDKLRSYSAARREVMPSVAHSTQHTKTIAVNCLTSRVDNKNGKCGVLNHKAKHNDFYCVMAL
nr:DDE-type integrase/transposase/recombinase [Glaciecola pallidula]